MKDQKSQEKRWVFWIGEYMNEYFVAGGTYKNLKGEEWFDLVCLGPGEPPYVMVGGVIDYFQLVWQDVHLYRVEEDYTLTLVAPSPEALQLGIEAPEKVWPDANILKKLRVFIKQSASVPAPKENGPGGCLELSDIKNQYPKKNCSV